MITKKSKFIFCLCILFDYDEPGGVTFKGVILMEVQEQGNIGQ